LTREEERDDNDSNSDDEFEGEISTHIDNLLEEPIKEGEKPKHLSKKFVYFKFNLII
jgi:hypothetical protein